MSIKLMKECECPRCKMKTETMIWTTVNPQIDPEAREDLLKGNLNSFECVFCGARIQVETQLLYHDGENRFCVWYFPFEEIQDINFLSRFNTEARYEVGVQGSTEDAAEYFKNIHYVFSIDEMARYILFREKLALSKNDRKQI